MKEEQETGFMHDLGLGKGQRHAHKTGQSLAQRGVPALHVGRFSGLAGPRLCVAPAGSPQRRPSIKTFRSAPADTPLQWLPTVADTSVCSDPRSQATTCRLFRQRAIQIQELCAFLSTNDRSSSSSRIVDVRSSASGASSVAHKGGS